MKQYDYLVIGGGIAGTSLAYRLAEGNSVAVLEMEDLPGYHTTGRSVAVWTTAYGPVEMQQLCHASSDFIHNPPEGFSDYPLYHDMGMMFVAKEDAVEDLKGLPQAGAAARTEDSRGVPRSKPWKWCPS